MRRFSALLAGASVACVFAASAFASPITGYGDPAAAIAGSAVIDFELTAIGPYTNLTVGPLSISGDGIFKIDNFYTGQYNATGNYFDNGEGSTDNYMKNIRFEFSLAVDAFAFNFGASNASWTLSAFNSLDSLLGTVAVPAIVASNAGEYYGFAGSGIAYALLQLDIQNTVGDEILIDNFAYRVAPVPVPAALPLFVSSLGLFGTVGLRRRRSRLRTCHSA